MLIDSRRFQTAAFSCMCNEETPICTCSLPIIFCTFATSERYTGGIPPDTDGAADLPRGWPRGGLRHCHRQHGRPAAGGGRGRGSRRRGCAGRSRRDRRRTACGSGRLRGRGQPGAGGKAGAGPHTRKTPTCPPNGRKGANPAGRRPTGRRGCRAGRLARLPRGGVACGEWPGSATRVISI